MHHRFTSVLRFVLLIVILTGMFGQPQLAKALSGVTVTAITPYVTLDSNNSCNSGPRGEFIQVMVTNNSGGTLNNLVATLDLPTTTPDGSYTGNWQLDSGESPNRYIGTLAAGAFS